MPSKITNFSSPSRVKPAFNLDTQMEINCKDVLEQIKTLSSNSINTTFCDPPYFLGCEWYQDENNRWQMRGVGKDFMNAWAINKADWWREYFKELFRVMKYGGYVIMYSITQQSDMVSGLLREAGFEKAMEGLSQKTGLHWANISNFPKASDASKSVDKRAGAERKVVGKHPNPAGSKGSTFPLAQECNITLPTTDLAKLLDGYKYGKAPLKKITEPILVFRKPCKFGSVLNDLMVCEKDIEISPAVLDIENCRVGIDLNDPNMRTNQIGKMSKCIESKNGIYGKFGITEKQDLGNHNSAGRFPATLFISPEAAELLDSQLDMITFELNGKIYTEKRLEYQRLISLHVLNNTFESAKILGVKREVMKGDNRKQKIGGDKEKHNPSSFSLNVVNTTNYSDSGYISRVLHQPDFTEQDFASLEYATNDLCQYSQGINEDTVYMPTVSPKERNAGCNHLLYKGIETLLVLHTKKGKTQKSKVEFDTLFDLELDSLGKSNKDKDKAICKIFFDLVCEASEVEISDFNFVEIAKQIKEYENDFGFFYLGNDLFKVFYQNNEFIIEAKNVIRNGNGHPTLKPISLGRHIFSLFLLHKAFNQIVYVPFSGSGSEVISVMQTGVPLENIISVEINPDFVAIQKARIEYHTKIEVTTTIPLQDNNPLQDNKPLQLF